MSKILVTAVLLTMCLSLIAQVIPDQSTLKSHAPASFQALFKTTKGGIGDKTEVNYFWDKRPIPDEPAMKKISLRKKIDLCSI